jgi:hypothetical protein
VGLSCEKWDCVENSGIDCQLVGSSVSNSEARAEFTAVNSLGYRWLSLAGSDNASGLNREVHCTFTHLAQYRHSMWMMLLMMLLSGYYVLVIFFIGLTEACSVSQSCNAIMFQTPAMTSFCSGKGQGNVFPGAK